VRGEHCWPQQFQNQSRGSSPRAWGTRTNAAREREKSRFIPTCVGNTYLGKKLLPNVAVHPHVRGEHRGREAGANRNGGSSPRAWGTRTSVAGSMVTRSVHPHVRGEHLKKSELRGLNGGSSPRAWGTPSAEASAASSASGSSPRAWGTRRHHLYAPVEITVHPHVRGEHTSATENLTKIIGSSPRAWGTRLRRGKRRLLRRFIPTCVGNTLSVPPASTNRAVHPHVRGEHRLFPCTKAALPGSSPRAWGTLVNRHVDIGAIRFIPTCVGNTLLPSR